MKPVMTAGLASVVQQSLCWGEALTSERKHGLYSALVHPSIYEILQRVMGANAMRHRFVRDYVRARPGDRVLDIGCGPAHLRAHLPDVQYIGWEPNADYVAKARTNYAGRGEFHVGLFGATQARSLAPVDIVIVSAVLHHMDDSQAMELFALVRGILKREGRVVTLDNVFIPRQNPIARLLISLDRGRHVRTAEGYQELARRSFERVCGDVLERAFPPYTYFFMVAQ
jgi:SAM-dependent methyltransferase